MPTRPGAGFTSSSGRGNPGGREGPGPGREHHPRRSPGVLAWLIRGAIRWNEVGLRAPDKAEYRKDEDTLSRFILECLDEVEPATHAVGRSVQEIYAQYKYWALANGHAVMSQKSLTSRLKARGNEYDESSHTWGSFPRLQVKMALTTSD